MSWTAVGSPVTGQNRFGFTLSLGVSPTLGNVLVVALNVDNNTDFRIPVPAGGGVTTWNSLGLAAGPPSLTARMYWGIVTTGGASTITMATTNNGVGAIVQEFSPSVTPTADSVSGTTSGTSTSGNYSSITPTNSGELYVAVLASRDPGSPGGSTAGFTYINYYPNFIGGMQLVYNLSATGAQSPAWTLGGSADFATFGGFLGPGTQTMQIIGIL